MPGARFFGACACWGSAGGRGVCVEVLFGAAGDGLRAVFRCVRMPGVGAFCAEVLFGVAGDGLRAGWWDGLLRFPEPDRAPDDRCPACSVAIGRDLRLAVAGCTRRGYWAPRLAAAAVSVAHAGIFRGSGRLHRAGPTKKTPLPQAMRSRGVSVSGFAVRRARCQASFGDSSFSAGSSSSLFLETRP